MSYEELDLDIDGVLDLLTKTPQNTLVPNKYPIQFEGVPMKEQFEFLLQLTTELCKIFFGNDQGQVDLGTLQKKDFDLVDKYVKAIGFNCYFESIPANSDNLNYMYNNRYDRIYISSTTNIKELKFAIRCNTILYVISFSNILVEEYNSRQQSIKRNANDNDINDNSDDNSVSKRIRIHK